MQIEQENKGKNSARHDQSNNSEQEVKDLLQVPTKCSNSPVPDKPKSNNCMCLKSSSDGLDNLCEAFGNFEGSTICCSSH